MPESEIYYYYYCLAKKIKLVLRTLLHNKVLTKGLLLFPSVEQSVTLTKKNLYDHIDHRLFTKVYTCCEYENTLSHHSVCYKLTKLYKP